MSLDMAQPGLGSAPGPLDEIDRLLTSEQRKTRRDLLAVAMEVRPRQIKFEQDLTDHSDLLQTYAQGFAALSVILPGNPVRCAYPHWSLHRTCGLPQGHEGMHSAPVLAPPEYAAEGVFTGHTYWGAPPTEWHLNGLRVYGEPAPHPIRDLTCGRWHKSCDVRWYPDGSARGYVCTRRSGHTGRHAAAAGSCIVAVWGLTHTPATAEQDEEDVGLEVTA
ncbi:hypothetical protein ACFWGN_17975 [Oerskovia sp. NPDC060338]|uniref:hypothetical protein n=1 Tax=Oerskovia sp. NPDC060338 TaxID=3347100 RepID=UPI00364E0F1C